MFTNGQILSDYKILDQLGSPGAYGQAHKALFLSDNTEVALKECFAETQDDLDRFEGENAILHSLQIHDNIIKPLSRILNENEVRYYTMELADENFQDYINKNYNLDLAKKLKLFINICKGLAHAHNTGVVHRDLWWKNVLIIERQDNIIPKISDFGRSRNFNAYSLTNSLPSRWGYLYITQPEFLIKYWNKPSQKNYILGDIYALGVLLHYCFEPTPLNYTPYFQHTLDVYIASNQIRDIEKSVESIRQHIYQDWLGTIDYSKLDSFRKLSGNDYSFLEKIDPIIERMCHPDFNQRFQSVEEVLTELEAI